MDAFSAQIVKFVREMPDDALLELVKQKLGVIGAAVSRAKDGQPKLPARAVPAAAPKGKSKRSPAPEEPREKRRAPPAGGPTPPSPATSADRQLVLDSVERVVKAGAGVSASDVARAASIPQQRAASALKELKLAKRIYQGGDRRFARYAGDAKTAEQAAATARKTARGPVLRPAVKSARGKGKKRSPPAPAGAGTV